MEVKLWTDGSYSIIDGVGIYGGGAVIYLGNQETPMECKWADSDSNWGRFRNVAGELLAVIGALKLLSQFKDQIDRVVIFYDYAGVELWVTGEWTARKACAKTYVRMMEEYTKLMNVSFVKVKAHSGVSNNNTADKLAREAVKEYSNKIKNIKESGKEEFLENARSLQSTNKPSN